jgi:beta-lactamase class D
MKLIHLRYFYLLSIVFLLSFCATKSVQIEPKIISKRFTQLGLQGSFMLFDEKHDTYLYHNRAQIDSMFSPGETFYLPLSLIGLHHQILNNKPTVFTWDSVIYPNQNWNVAQSLNHAFKHNTPWFFNKLIKGIGHARILNGLIRFNYGNKDTTGGLDNFWKHDGLKISPKQQIDFLRKLRNGKLDCKKENQDVLKRVSVVTDSLGCSIHQEFGIGSQDGKDITWLVGYMETPCNTFYFSTCTQSIGKTRSQLIKTVKSVTYKIINDLKIMHLKKKDKLPEYKI